jgi:hypothetical protein
MLPVKWLRSFGTSVQIASFFGGTPLEWSSERYEARVSRVRLWKLYLVRCLTIANLLLNLFWCKSHKTNGNFKNANRSFVLALCFMNTLTMICLVQRDPAKFAYTITSIIRSFKNLQSTHIDQYN